MIIWRFFDAILYPFQMFLYTIGYWFPTTGGWSRISWPAKIAAAVWLVLLVFFLVVAYRDYRTGTPRWQDEPALWLTVVLGALVCTPLLVYWALRLLTVPPQRFPEVDLAWSRGLDFASARGQEIAEFPIILMINPGEYDSFTRFHNNAATSITGSQPTDCFFWAFEHDALFIHLTSQCCLAASTKPGATAGMSATNEGQSVQIDQEGLIADEDGSSGPDEYDLDDLGETAKPEDQIADEDDLDLTHTDGQAELLRGHTSIVTADETERLSYLLTLIARFCPQSVSPDGVVVVIPSHLFSADSIGLEAFQVRLQRDLEVLNRRLRVRIPLTFLVAFDGAQLELSEAGPHATIGQGFVQLAEFFKSSQKSASRIGVSIEPKQTPPNDSANREKIAEEVSSFMSDRIFGCLADPTHLSKQVQNQHLLSFGCWVRNEWQRGFAKLLQCSVPESRARDDARFQIAGTYFGYVAADDQDRDLYINGVKKKAHGLISCAEFLPWYRQQDERLRRIAGVMLGIAVILLLLVLYVSFGSGPTASITGEWNLSTSTTSANPISRNSSKISGLFNDSPKD